MKKNLLLLPLTALLLFPGCSKSPSQDLPPTLLWAKDQNRIHPTGGTMNVWEGFRVDKDTFTAERDISQFILWRNREEKVPIAIEYSLQGRKVEFSINIRKKRMLPPTAAFKWQKSNFQLSHGINFLKFSKKSKDNLRIRSIVIGPIIHKASPHLQPGESFSLFHLPGRGRLELSGRGKLEIGERQAVGAGLEAKTRTMKNGWFSRTISLPLEFTRPGLLTVTCKTGDFNISAYSYVPTPTRELDPKITFKSKSNICIVLSDACQASHLGTYGYHRNTSPQIDAFARDAVVYENAYTNAVITRASVATVFTGLYPDNHKVRLQGNLLPQKYLTLPEYLNAKGYATSVITSNFSISPRYGFTQGVDAYFGVLEKYWASKEFSIFDRFSNWLAKTPQVHFSFMHYLHPHFPKVPPADFPVTFRPDGKKVTLGRMNNLTIKRKTAILPNANELQEVTDGYDSSIAWVDSEFGKILSLLKGKKLYDDSMIIFLADHGEALGEHGIMGHGSTVYDETTRVPLIVKYPKNLNLKGRVHQLVELADIFPTIAALFGQQLKLDGRNLLANGFEKEMDDRFVVSRTGSHYATYGLRWKNWLYLINLFNNHEQLYSLATDPYREIGASHPAIRAFLNARFLDWYARFRNGSGKAAEIPLKSLPASEIEEMKALGYL
ncbi:MAG: sulfatase [Chrysiogenia bacterium]